MKRNLLFACSALFGSTMLLGQGLTNNSPNNEGFEDGGLPPCWENLDEDGDGYFFFSWGIDPAMGDSCVASASYLNGIGPLTPENYLILPQVTPMADEHLSFYVGAQDPGYAAEKFDVVVSTTGTAATDFATSLHSETLADAAWAHRTVDLTAYVGMDIYLAIKHWDVTDQFYIKFDEFQYPTLTAPCTVGIEENETEYKIDMYPNPANDDVTIQSEERIESIDITDISGRFISNTVVNNTRHMIADNDLIPGIYFVTVNFNDGSTTQKLIIE